MGVAHGHLNRLHTAYFGDASAPMQARGGPCRCANAYVVSVGGDGGIRMTEDLRPYERGASGGTADGGNLRGVSPCPFLCDLESVEQKEQRWVLLLSTADYMRFVRRMSRTDQEASLQESCCGQVGCQLIFLHVSRAVLRHGAPARCNDNGL